MRVVLLLIALAFIRHCAAESDTRADEFLNRAVALAKSSRLVEAEQLLIQGISAFPKDARFLVELAGVSWRQKQIRRARAYLRQGLRIDPSSAYANEFLGSLYLLDGNLHAAVKYWNRIRRPVISGVTFTPELPLRSEMIQRLPAVSAGQLLTASLLARSEQSFENLRIFSEPIFELAPEQSDEYRLSVRTPPLAQPIAGAAGRLLPLLRGLPYQQVNLDLLNIGRRAITLTSLWRWDPDKRRIAAMYRTPTRNGAYAFWTDLRDEDWDLNRTGTESDAFGVRSAAVGGEISFDLSGNVWTPSVHLSRHTFQTRAALSQEGSDWLLANSTLWEVRNRFGFARWRHPERRVQIDSSITVRTGRAFSRDSSRLVGAEFDASGRWYPQQRDDLYTVGSRVRAGALYGRVPIDELYITAMERDNDLWLRGHAGTRDGKKGNAPMGTRFAVSQNEVMRRLLRIPFLRVDAGPFFDVANIGGDTPFGSRGWLYDTGAQAVLTTFGRFRFSVIYGRDLRDGNNVLYTAISR